MKIGFITAYPPVRDGIADYSYYLIDSMKDVSRDCTFYVMAPLVRHTHKTQVTSCSERVMLFRIWKMYSLKDILASIILLVKALFVIKADVLHIQYRFTRDQGGSAGEPFFILMLAAKKLTRKTKIVVSLHDFWLPKEAEQRAYEITKSKMLSKLYKFYYSAYVRATLKIPDLIISIVNANKSPVTEYIKRYTTRKVVEALHGLPPASNQRKTSYAKHNAEELRIGNKFTILLFGFVRKDKGYQYVIKAIRKIIDSQPSMKERIKVMIVGVPSSPREQPYLDYLKKLVHALDLDDVVSIITKYLNNEEIGEFFRAANITIIPYTRRVGPSGILSFALAYDVPSIITCDKKYITNEISLPSLKVKLDIDDIASAILTLMTGEDEYSEQIRRIRKYKSVNTNRKIALLHVRLYNELCYECAR